MNILQAILDPNLFRPFFGGKLDTWRPWLTALRAVYGLPIPDRAGRDLVKACTGRDVSTLPRSGFQTSLFLTGRRSGKSRTAAVVGAFEAVLAGHEKKLARGEQGVVAVVAPSKHQARIVKDYMRACFEVPLLAEQVERETSDGFELVNGNRVDVMAGHWRTARGYTLIACICDEMAFFGLDEEAKVKSDTELVRAIRPGLATVGGKLIAITSPYAKRGWTYQQFQRHHGNPAGTSLVWKCGSRVMNATLPQSVVDEALAEDLAAARAEFLGEFREDVDSFVSREVVEAVVVPGRSELLPVPGVRYFAFCDPSGGRSDDAALAIAHRDGRTVVVDVLRRWKAPHDPHHVVGQMVRELSRFGLDRVTGDNFAAEWVASAFHARGVKYRKAKKNKSDLYRELLPRLSSRELELPDDAALIGQLAGLERRTRSGGRDIIDHPPGGHDDLANAVAGVADEGGHRLIRVGPLRRTAPTAASLHRVPRGGRFHVR